MPDVLTERARVASLTRSRRTGDPELIQARRNLTEAKIEQAIQKAIAEAPPLTDIQRKRLADLLRVGSTP